MNKVSEKIRKELDVLAGKPESAIDFSDIPPADPQAWQAARRGQFYRPIKQQLTVRIDADVLDWLKEQGKGYQSRLNDILRTEMLKNMQRKT